MATNASVPIWYPLEDPINDTIQSIGMANYANITAAQLAANDPQYSILNWLGNDYLVGQMFDNGIPLTITFTNAILGSVTRSAQPQVAVDCIGGHPVHRPPTK